MNAKRITNPAVHVLTGDAYGATQTSDEIKDGDVLIVPAAGVVGFLCGAWPVAVKGSADEIGFHTLDPAADITRLGAHPGRLDECLTYNRDWDGPASLPVHVWPLSMPDPGTDYSATIALIDTIPAMRCDGPGRCSHCDA